jgi:hypothetical protein
VCDRSSIERVGLASGNRESSGCAWAKSERVPRLQTRDEGRMPRRVMARGEFPGPISYGGLLRQLLT